MTKVPSRRGFLAASAGVTAALAGGGLLTGGSPAAAAVPAGDLSRLPGSCSSDPDPAHPKRQLRGVWIASVSNIDWPSAPGLSAAQQQAELVALLDAAVRMRMNAVYLQIRPAADALYDSRYEPWSQYLTGTQGQDPGYDPLAFAVAEAHKRNLELHAWMNPYRVSTQPDPNQLVPTHPARVHPDWCVEYGGELYYNPGVPAVLDFDVQVITDVASRYDIDGIHFDDYFYPYPVGTTDFPDDATFAAYGAGFPDKATWRRANVDKLVSTLQRELRAVKPWMKWGISPFGIWRNQATDPLGSATNGLQSYDALSADTRGWVQKGWLDYVAPQLYWNIGFPPAAYDVLVDWWSKAVDGTGTQLLIGQTISKIGISNPPAWLDPNEMPNHLILDRKYPEVAGDIYFNITKLLTDPLGFQTRLITDLYEYPALVPEMPRHPGPAPDRTALTEARPSAAGTRLQWLNLRRPHGVEAAYYAVYRFDGHPPHSACDFADARNLLGTVRAVSGLFNGWTDASAVARNQYTYHVTAVDRLHHESEASNPQVVG
ncbi:family 10 glycosylhydrolase [Catenulispora sp. NL8]|uniref:Family 10 glycosylhydrolase n=1 Tax=Catenulispora pinistramenti TaxID=2705254 RepID=A0ABS5L028_9ACTN|nr:family 10 glycosylhydrolase [Catenulispora pinistramenti]MBS2551614.1 family 10 glycosylhydrolase [Catenulispora pinistramenti]